MTHTTLDRGRLSGRPLLTPISPQLLRPTSTPWHMMCCRRYSLTGRKKIVIAYSYAKFAPGGKEGELCVPTTGAFKAFTDRFKGRVAAIDEFRTSKECIQKKKGCTVRGLLWCSSTMENSKLFVNRDLNAAINIHNCFTMYPTRPGILARPKKYCKRENKTKENYAVSGIVGPFIMSGDRLYRQH